jgi:hypothetical protein
LEKGTAFGFFGVAEMAQGMFTIVEGKTKVVEIVKDLNVGDVVLVMQQGLSRGNWPLGRIIDVYPGKDRHTCTRVTKVQCGQKTYIWPIHKLIDLMI